MSEVTVYPTPPGLRASEAFAVRAGHEAVFTEETSGVHLARFGTSTATLLEIDVAEDVDKVVVRPRRLGLEPRIEKRRITLDLPVPGYYWIEVNDFDPLVVAADPPENHVPKADDPAVRFFGPGEHDTGPIELQDNETIYIAPGAVVYGAIVGRAENVKVAGRGILDAGRLERPAKAIELVRAKNVEIEGIVVRNSPCWTTSPMWCDGVTFRHVKFLSNGRNGDGIDIVASRNVRVEGCFFRCTDDCIALKAHVDPRFLWQSEDVPNEGNIENISVSQCVMGGWKWSDGFTIGFEMRGEYVRNIEVRDCDILYARGNNSVDGHSAFSVICDGPATVSNVLFEDLRAEENVLKAFELNVTDGQCYTKGAPGRIRNVTVRNCVWMEPRPFILAGQDGLHQVERVRFENCRVGDKPLLGPQDAPFEINEYVQEVEFL